MCHSEGRFFARSAKNDVRNPLRINMNFRIYFRGFLTAFGMTSDSDDI